MRSLVSGSHDQTSHFAPVLFIAAVLVCCWGMGLQTAVAQSFAPKSDYGTGTNPRLVAVGDFNLDGKPDLAVANQTNTTVSVFINNGAGTLAAKVDYTTGSTPFSVAVGDFNADGKPDLAVANFSSNTVSVFINNGAGTLAAKVDYPTGTSPFSVAVGDFNADGKPDLAVVNRTSTTVSVLINNGAGTFAAKVDYPTGSVPGSVAVGDFNVDGKPDLAVANNNSDTVSVFINNGAGTFAAKVDYTTGTGPRSVAVGDFNLDSKPDLAVINQSANSMSVLINNGAGTFAAKVDYPTGSIPFSVAVGDFNVDGKPDLAVTNRGSNTVSVFINNGPGTFAAKVDYPTGSDPISVAVGDFNADGKPDLAVANSNSNTVSQFINRATAPTAADATISGQVTMPDGAPLGGVMVTLSGAKSAWTLTDSKGNYRFDNVDTDNFYIVTPGLQNYSFSPANRSFSLLGHHSDATFTAVPNTALGGNAIDTSEYFVRQQYLDFLGREPDQGGLEYWYEEIARCGTAVSCVNKRRIDVSASFFMAQEFQETGSFVYGLYKASFGTQPSYQQFTTDRAKVIGGIDLDARKHALAAEWVQRDSFRQAYPEGMTAEEFVTKLFASVGLLPRSGEWETYVRTLNNGAPRAEVLRALISDPDFTAKEYNPSFVLMEYFAYLRRDPDPGGYAFWLNVLDTREPDNFRGMVCAFITSTEYQQRFGPIVRHTNGECGR